ncbi:MAG: PAS domain-containing protein [Candidatus Hodarchaeales archaeon]|jgi:PAS domain S-box-containing protein
MESRKNYLLEIIEGLLAFYKEKLGEEENLNVISSTEIIQSICQILGSDFILLSEVEQTKDDRFLMLPVENFCFKLENVSSEYTVDLIVKHFRLSSIETYNYDGRKIPQSLKTIGIKWYLSTGIIDLFELADPMVHFSLEKKRYCLLLGWRNPLSKSEKSNIDHKFSVEMINFLTQVAEAFLNKTLYEEKTITWTKSKLVEEQEKFRTLFTYSSDAIYIVSRDGKIIDFNQSALDLFGYDKDEVKNVDVEKMYLDHDVRKDFQKAIQEKGLLTDYKVKLVRKDKTVMDCTTTSSVVTRKDGYVTEYVGIIKDTSREKENKVLKKYPFKKNFK